MGTCAGLCHPGDPTQRCQLSNFLNRCGDFPNQILLATFCGVLETDMTACITLHLLCSTSSRFCLEPLPRPKAHTGSQAHSCLTQQSQLTTEQTENLHHSVDKLKIRPLLPHNPWPPDLWHLWRSLGSETQHTRHTPGHDAHTKFSAVWLKVFMKYYRKAVSPLLLEICDYVDLCSPLSP